jgi:hypothetical protein
MKMGIKYNVRGMIQKVFNVFLTTGCIYQYPYFIIDEKTVGIGKTSPIRGFDKFNPIAD